MTIETLDYKPTKLAMEATNEVEATYRVRAVAKERWTVDFIESIPAGSVFWDLGANVGAYTLIAASRGLVPVAIEPACNNYAALCRNMALNNFLDRGLVLCCALGEHTRFDWLQYTDLRQGAASHLLGGQRKDTFHRQAVQVWTWDELRPRLPLPADRAHFAKIDVDGGEIRLLKGASETLKGDWLQGIMIEMQTAAEAEITKLLTASGWKLTERFDERDGKRIPGLAYGRFARG